MTHFRRFRTGRQNTFFSSVFLIHRIIRPVDPLIKTSPCRIRQSLLFYKANDIFSRGGLLKLETGKIKAIYETVDITMQAMCS